MTRVARGMATVLAGLSVGLAGCGDGGEPAASDAHASSKRDFIASADRLCANAGEEYDAAIADLPPFEEIVASDVSQRVMRATAEAGDRNAYLAGFQRFDRAGTASSAALRDYGFRVCAAG